MPTNPPRIPAGRALPRRWFVRDTLEVARDLIGCTLCRRLPDGRILRLPIHETEAYDGPEDLACHAHTNRKTKRNAVMFERGGLSYIYLCYGVHWLFNIVTGPRDYPAAVLLRGAGPFDGPGKLTKGIGLSGADDRQPIGRPSGLWVEHPGGRAVPEAEIQRTPRIGIDYAGPHWSQVPYRFLRRGR